jgi:pimeloyl-ACP methyl ester carboxylesterase
MEYAVVGTGEPLLVVHGSAGGFDQGLDMSAYAAERGFQLITPSRFGYLRSAMPANATPAMQADAFAQILDKLDIKRTAIVSISAGSWPALEFAARYPERCRVLILLVPAGELPPGVSNYGGPLVKALFGSDFLTWGASKLARIAPGAMGSTMLGTPATIIDAASPDEKARLLQIIDHLLPITARTAGIQLDIQIASQPPTTLREKIACPVLAISTADDQFGTNMGAQTIIRAVPDGRLIIYPSGGHALVGRQGQILDDMTAFLKAHP